MNFSIKQRFSIGALIFLSLVSCVHSSTDSISSASRKVSNNSDTTSSEKILELPWSYDPGPEVDTAMGKELIDIVSRQPNMPEISEKITGDQKFRPAFGPTLWRMIQKPNSVKILFIGQDGTHIAEAAGRTATAGFGGRAQDMAAHFGVETGAAFMNTYAFTIKGQYAGRGALMISEKNGKKQAQFNQTIIDNGIWMMTHDQKGPMAKWRNSLIDWIIRNNRDSLKLVVLFGGSARDSIGTFIESHGGSVGSRYSTQDLDEQKIQVPRFKFVSTGGNGEMPIALMKNEKGLFESMGLSIDYKQLTSTNPAIAKAANAKLLEAQKIFSSQLDQYYSQLSVVPGGLQGSGLIHPAQIGGYDLDKIKINGQKTISLKGLKLSDGSEIKNDILVADFPHPTALSSLPKDQAESRVESSLQTLKSYKKLGWRIEPDEGQINKFDLMDTDPNSKYKYGRSEIPLNFYDFGTPQNRMVSVSSAYRMSGYRNIVVIGTRDKANFNMDQLTNATSFSKPTGIDPEEFYTARPRTLESRYNFDHGPGEKLAQIMKDNLNLDQIGKMKSGGKANESCRSPENISNFNVKTHPLCVGDFGHYRGLVNKPEVIILADPAGLDDILTSRALTGARGQYIQGLMNDLGVKDNYLVIKTVPFGMDGATDDEWQVVMKQTSEYRKKIFEYLLSNPAKLIIADGKYASQEVSQLVGNKSPVVKLNRQTEDNSFGLDQVYSEIVDKKIYPQSISFKARMDNIPRSHLGFFSRVWEGTSGTHVFNPTSADAVGNVFAIVVPSWAYYQKFTTAEVENVNQEVKTLNQVLIDLKLPFENEKYADYAKRLNLSH